MSVAWFGVLLVLLLGKAPSLAFFLRDVDFGIRLGAGRQVLLGKTPHIDLFYVAGPLWAYTPALGLWIHDSPIPEILICSAGYGLSLFLVSYLVASNLRFGRIPDILVGMAAGLVGLMYLGRFYKWYYWLFPLLVLFCLFRAGTYPESKGLRLRWLGFAGLSAGLGLLYRIDLGIGCLFSVLAWTFLNSIPPFATDMWLRRMLVAITGFVIPVGSWLLLLGLAGGAGAWRDLSVGLYQSVFGSIDTMHEPFPTFDFSNPFALSSGLAIFHLMAPATYLAGITYVLLRRGKSPPENAASLRFLMAASITGLALWPEALQRTAVVSFLSVLPPLVITGTILCGLLWGPIKQFRGLSWKSWALRVVVVVYLAILAVAGRGIRSEAAVGLEPFGHTIIERYSLLARGIPEGMDHPTVKLVEGIHARTDVGDTVLYGLPYLAALSFIDRPISGFLVTHLRGIFSEKEWRDRNLRLIRLHPPSVVIAERGYANLQSGTGFRESFPELDAYVRENYTIDRPFTDELVFWTVLVPRAPGQSELKQGRDDLDRREM